MRRLKNKKTGENYEMTMPIVFNIKTSGGGEHTVRCESIKELNEKWTDYEEPKEYWYIDYDGGILCSEYDNSSAEKMMISMGNHFDSLEEAEEVVRKLKAWKRLKDKGFRFKDYTRKFDGFKRVDGSVFIVAELDDEGVIGMIDELNICFGGEE